MAAKTALTVRVHISGVREVLAALKQLPKDASVELKAAALEISKEIAAEAKQAGINEGRQAALVATTVRAAKDRLPVVVAGGNKKLGSNKKPAYKLLFGSEFGANYYDQFGKPHIGTESYWFFKTIKDNQVEISRRWLEAADEVVRKFGGS
ncbi:hypothetical protein [Paractinoplanes hotanensis]|uniref:HK97 gp10 family phage protein n=1 Tax=Paractinoplanes hotanensis TaxID=2906497 RepID=A0ABT0Y301_9ACTN|nr:hypothetical protein [Actinoplanes hotanensis]MCM4080408.1 hypothetical protein [Actinoplanes hotanensis]